MEREDAVKIAVAQNAKTEARVKAFAAVVFSASAAMVAGGLFFGSAPVAVAGGAAIVLITPAVRLLRNSGVERSQPERKLPKLR